MSIMSRLLQASSSKNVQLVLADNVSCLTHKLWFLTFCTVQIYLLSYNRVRSKVKVQNSSTFQGLSRTQIAFFKHQNYLQKTYPRRGHSKFRQQRDTEVYCTHQYRNDKSKWQIAISKQAKWNQILFPSTGDMHTSACFKIVNKINAKFQNLQDLNSRTFHVLSSTLSVFKHFQGPWSFYSKFKHFQGFLKHAMNPVTITTPLSTSGSC